MQKKLDEYFAAGARQVWHLFPETQTVKIFTSPTTFTELTATNELVGGDLLPTFRRTVSTVSELFSLE